MAVSQFNDDVNIIAALGDNPVTDDGLTTAQFKAKFDEAANLIKTYINSVLVPNVLSKISGSGLLKSVNGAISIATANTDYAAATHASRHASNGDDPLPASSVGASQLATDSVSTGAIQSGAVVAAKLGSDILPAHVGIKMGTAEPTTSDISEGQIYLKYEA